MIQSTAKVSPDTKIGRNTVIDEYTIISSEVTIGDECKIHKNIFIDAGVSIGSRVKIQDGVMIPHGVSISDGVFIGPSVAFTNDKHPRSINKDGSLKTSRDWNVNKTQIGYGASLGANSTIICGVTIGKWAMVGAGSVVVHDVPDYALVVGCPAKIIGWVDKSGYQMTMIRETDKHIIMYSVAEKEEYLITKKEWI